MTLIYSVLPLQPGCPHLQSTSGVFSIASHSTLQYFPVVTVHEQIGCAHFFPSAISILLDKFVTSTSTTAQPSRQRHTVNDVCERPDMPHEPIEIVWPKR